ncbi:MAG TPA: hypothetical protein VNT79_16505 [Phycisphaerae bacterium]|nr:hypothetical protein [Phycisphaerae bacterium]
MSIIEQQVKLAQRRLWLNRWIRQWGWSLAITLGVWTMAWLVNRLFVLYPFPALWTLTGALAASLLGATAWLFATRDPMLTAAAALDHAAGLRERVSTGLSLKADSADPFEAAAYHDATAKVTSLTPRKFLPLRWPRSLSLGGVLAAAALLSLLLPELDLLNRKDGADQRHAQAASQTQTQAIIARTSETIDKIAQQNKIDLEIPSKPHGRVKMPDQNTPEFRRRETIKKLDRLQESLKEKMGEEKFQALKESKKQFRQLAEKTDAKTQLSELISAMASNDLDEARKAVKKLQEKLAKRAAEGGQDSEDAKKMQEQLKQLAQKMKEAANTAQKKQQEQQKRDLQNAGMSAEEAMRTLEQLAKKDPQQLEKLAKELAQRMKDKGVTPEQMQKMLEKMQQQMKSCDKGGKQCQQMGDKMAQAAAKMSEGQLGEAAQQLSEMAEKLGEMEQLEQAMNDMEGQMAELEQAGQEMEDDLESSKSEQPCDKCNGTGFREDGSPCGKCDGTGKCGGGQCNKNGQGAKKKGPGKGGGKGGSGAGDKPASDHSDEYTDLDDAKTRNVKARTHFRPGGGIVSQRRVKDKQIGGDSTAVATDAESAEEIDDTDAVERERIPRVYRKGVKRFFDRLEEDEDAGSDAPDSDSTKSDDSPKKAKDSKTGKKSDK